MTVAASRSDRARALKLTLAAFGRVAGDGDGGRDRRSVGSGASGSLGRSHMQLGGRSLSCLAFGGGRGLGGVSSGTASAHASDAGGAAASGADMGQGDSAVGQGDSGQDGSSQGGADQGQGGAGPSQHGLGPRRRGLGRGRFGRPLRPRVAGAGRNGPAGAPDHPPGRRRFGTRRHPGRDAGLGGDPIRRRRSRHGRCSTRLVRHGRLVPGPTGRGRAARRPRARRRRVQPADRPRPPLPEFVPALPLAARPTDRAPPPRRVPAPPPACPARPRRSRPPRRAGRCGARANVSEFEGRPEDDFAMDGRTRSAYLGLDYRFGSGFLMGLAGSRSDMAANYESGINGVGKTKAPPEQPLPLRELVVPGRLRHLGLGRRRPGRRQRGRAGSHLRRRPGHADGRAGRAPAAGGRLGAEGRRVRRAHDDGRVERTCGCRDGRRAAGAAGSRAGRTMVRRQRRHADAHRGGRSLRPGRRGRRGWGPKRAPSWASRTRAAA